MRRRDLGQLLVETNCYCLKLQGVLLVLVAVLAFAFKGQYVLAASKVPVDVSAIKWYWYFC